MTNHPDDHAAIERLHCEFINRFDRVNDDLMLFQDQAYAMGRARGLQEAATAAYDESAQRLAFEDYAKTQGYSLAMETPLMYMDRRTCDHWRTWQACAKGKAGVAK